MAYVTKIRVSNTTKFTWPGNAPTINRIFFVIQMFSSFKPLVTGSTDGRSSGVFMNLMPQSDKTLYRSGNDVEESLCSRDNTFLGAEIKNSFKFKLSSLITS